MRLSARTRLALLAVSLTLAPRPPSAVGQPEPVAIVYRLSGSAVADGKKPIGLFDRFPVGTAIRVGAASRLTLAFWNGSRYELGENARVRVSATQLVETSGPTRLLPSVPPLPPVERPADASVSGSPYAAVRIRGAKIRGLYPACGTATVAERTVLRFSPLSTASRYDVEVTDKNGSTVLRKATSSAVLQVEPGVLRPGVRYVWTVKTGNTVAEAASGTECFQTLGTDLAASRAALAEALEKAGDAPSLALLSEIDRGLGLLWEAHEELRAALAKSPSDVRLREAFTRLDRDLAKLTKG